MSKLQEMVESTPPRHFADDYWNLNKNRKIVTQGRDIVNTWGTNFYNSIFQGVHMANKQLGMKTMPKGHFQKFCAYAIGAHDDLDCPACRSVLPPDFQPQYGTTRKSELSVCKRNPVLEIEFDIKQWVDTCRSEIYIWCDNVLGDQPIFCKWCKVQFKSSGKRSRILRHEQLSEKHRQKAASEAGAVVPLHSKPAKCTGVIIKEELGLPLPCKKVIA